ncbi:MAG: DUF4175 family protein [Bradymonadaceae bacterium]
MLPNPGARDPGRWPPCSTGIERVVTTHPTANDPSIGSTNRASNEGGHQPRQRCFMDDSSQPDSDPSPEGGGDPGDEAEAAPHTESDESPDQTGATPASEEDAPSGTARSAGDDANGGDTDASEGDGHGDGNGGESGQSDGRHSNGSNARQHLRALRTILRKTRRRWRRQQLAEGVFWYAAALAAVFATAVLAAGIVPDAAATVARWILYGGGSAATIGGSVALWGFVRKASGLEATARALERAERDFRSDIVAALEFGEQMVGRPDAGDRELGFSRALAETHLGRTVDQLRERAGDANHLAALLPDRPLEPPLFAVVGCVLLMLVSYGLAPGSTVEALRAPLSSASTATDDSKHVRPVVRDLRLRYTPPSYTGAEQRTEVNSTGHIEAVVGTEVTIDAVPLFRNADIEMVVETGGDQRVVSMESGPRSRRVRTDLVLSESGTYHFRAVLPDGTTIEDGTERSIETKPDHKPKVQITSHEGTVEVSPNDVLKIAFSTRDDFGVSSAYKVHHFAGNKSDKQRSRVDLPSLENTPSSAEGKVTFDLRPLSLKPKDRIVFQIEARDNNTRTGPGVGTSDPLVLKVSSPEDEHMEVLEAERRLADELLLVLADYLEHPVGERVAGSDSTYTQKIPEDADPSELAKRLTRLRSVHRREGRVLSQMKSLLDRMKSDPLMSDRNLSLFEGLYKQLRDLHERGGQLYEELAGENWDVQTLDRRAAKRVADFVSSVEQKLERGLLRLLELVASQKMEAIKATREDIQNLKNELKKLLKKYKKTKDPKLKKKIQRQIARLRQRMSELMTRMQSQLDKLPERHLNEEALKKKQLKSNTRKMANSLNSLQQKLKNGNIDGALKSLKRLDQRLSSLGKKMNRQFAGAQPRGLSKLDKKVSKLMNEVNDLRNQENALEKKTRRLQNKAQKARQKRIRKMLEKKMDELRQRVERQQKDLKAIGEKKLPEYHRYGLKKNRKSLRKLRQAVEQQDVQQALEAAKSSMESLESMRFNLGLAKRQTDPKSTRGRNASAAKRRVDGDMMPRAKKIEKSLRRMKKRAKSMKGKTSGEQLKRLAKRQKNISERAKKLQKKIRKSSKQFPMLEKQLSPKLKRARKEMGKAKKRLKKGRGRGALDSERAALKKLKSLKQSMKRTLKKKRSRREGGRGMKREEVEIPGEDDGPSREALREEVMKAMDGGKLEGYEDAIEQYYKNIVK